MPVLTEYRHGLTMGNPPGRNDHQRAKRSTVEGWTEASTRRNTRFLYSVDERKLTGHGFGLSLTVRDCPPTGDDWKQLRERFVKRLRRMGMIRMHWLTEWQRRGCPHMHAAVWFDDGLRDRDPMAMATIVTHWVTLASEYGAGRSGQHVAQITDAKGWFQYLSKHAVRGLGHYQRSAEGVPSGWERTGRMWGYLGDWPTISPVRYTLDMPAFWAFRRLVQRWRYADARASGDRYRIRSARRMLQSSNREAGAVRGVSEWIGTDETQHFLRHLAAMGHEVTC